jgi:hypothetical protein
MTVTEKNMPWDSASTFQERLSFLWLTADPHWRLINRTVLNMLIIEKVRLGINPIGGDCFGENDSCCL